MRRGRPVQRARVVRVDEDVPVQNVSGLTALIERELPVGRLFGLGVGHRLQADEMVVREGAPPGGFLLAPVLERIGLRMRGLVNDEEVGAGWILDVDVDATMRDLPATRHTD